LRRCITQTFDRVLRKTHTHFKVFLSFIKTGIIPSGTTKGFKTLNSSNSSTKRALKPAPQYKIPRACLLPESSSFPPKHSTKPFVTYKNKSPPTNANNPPTPAFKFAAAALLVEEATRDVVLPVFPDVAEPVAAALLLAGEAPVAVPEGDEASTVR
jgi:hypothetical protein